MNKHKGQEADCKETQLQKRWGGGRRGEGPAEDAQEDAEKAKGTEGGSKASRRVGRMKVSARATASLPAGPSVSGSPCVSLGVPVISDTCAPHSAQPALW